MVKKVSGERKEGCKGSEWGKEVNEVKEVKEVMEGMEVERGRTEVGEERRADSDERKEGSGGRKMEGRKEGHH
jgi:hypothetical protein